MIQPLLKPEQVAEILNVSRKTVVSLARKGELPCIRIHNRLRFEVDEVAALVRRKGGRT